MALHYIVIAQSIEDVQNVLNSPSAIMTRYLIHSAQTEVLKHISMYTARATSSGHMRFLYLNPVAFGVWAAMKKSYRLIGRVQQPPPSASLILGTPFSE